MNRGIASLIQGSTAVLLAALAVYFLGVRNMYYVPPEGHRAAQETWPPHDVVVAIVCPEHLDASLRQGVALAFDELNASQSPLAHKIRLVDYAESPHETGVVARRIAGEDRVIAVIGHELAETALPSSITYENHGILFISPTISLRRLSTHGFQYTFRLMPDENALMDALVTFAVSHGLKRIGVMYGRIEHGEAAARSFLERSAAKGLQVPFFKSYVHRRRSVAQDFRPLIAGVQTIPVNAILIADQMPWGGMLLRDLQAMSMDVPVLATEAMDSADVWSLVGKAANNLFVPSVVDPDSSNPAFASFRERFRARYHASPDARASQGYEAFSLLQQAAERSHSVNPLVLATTLRTSTWPGLFGEFSFSANGEIQGRDVIIKRMQDGRFKAVSIIDVAP